MGNVEYAGQLRSDFLNIKNAPYVGDEYYYVILSVSHDSYDGIYSTSYLVKVDVTHYKYKSFFGVQFAVSNGETNKQYLGVYGKKTINGIYEMVTGKELSVNGKSGAINCIGVSKVDDYAINKVVSDLKLVDSDPGIKQRYIASLMNASAKALEFNRFCDNSTLQKQQEQESNIQYLRSFKFPRN